MADARADRLRYGAAVALIALYAAARVLQALPDRIPMMVTVAAHVGLPLLFVFVHGSAIYRLRGTLVFVGLSLATSAFFESLSLRTGFPFGHYHFTDVMGVKVLQLPVMLGLAYVGMGYASWMVGWMLLSAPGGELKGWQVVTVPLAASLAMVSWDLAMDPVWANLVHAWVWHDGGQYFGVPLSNFFGWALTTWVMYQLFALYVRRVGAKDAPVDIWRLAAILYAVTAVGNAFVIAAPAPAFVRDAAGNLWRVRDLLVAMVAVSVGLMGGMAALGIWRTTKSRVRPASE